MSDVYIEEVYKLEKDTIREMRELNLKLNELYFKFHNFDDEDETYVNEMVRFLNSLDRVKVKRFDCIEDINTSLKHISDIDGFKEYYQKCNGNIEGSIMIDEYGSEIGFIAYEEIYESMIDMIGMFDENDTIKFNKCIVNLLWL